MNLRFGSHLGRRKSWKKHSTGNWHPQHWQQHLGCFSFCLHLEMPVPIGGATATAMAVPLQALSQAWLLAAQLRPVLTDATTSTAIVIATATGAAGFTNATDTDTTAAIIADRAGIPLKLNLKVMDFKLPKLPPTAFVASRLHSLVLIEGVT
jgi:hypothetical protein